MATYRALQDIDLGKNWGPVLAGTILTDQPPVPNIPVGWVPPAAVDPLDTGAVTAFWNAGVQLLGLVRQQWNGINVVPPVTFWKVDPAAGPGNPYRQFVLAGLGAGLGMVQLLGTRGVQP
jgi:hypothetical protein